MECLATDKNMVFQNNLEPGVVSEKQRNGTVTDAVKPSGDSQVILTAKNEARTLHLLWPEGLKQVSLYQCCECGCYFCLEPHTISYSSSMLFPAWIILSSVVSRLSQVFSWGFYSTCIFIPVSCSPCSVLVSGLKWGFQEVKDAAWLPIWTIFYVHHQRVLIWYLFYFKYLE